MLQVDFSGGFCFRFPHRHPHESLSLPALSDLSVPSPLWVGGAGVDHIVVSGEEHLGLDCAVHEICEHVNKRLVADWPVREEAPSHQCSPCILPAVFVAHSWWWLFFLSFIFILFFSRCSCGEGRQREKVGEAEGEVSWGWVNWPGPLGMNEGYQRAGSIQME